jgi:hypothetical protein
VTMNPTVSGGSITLVRSDFELTGKPACTDAGLCATGGITP